MLIESEQDLWGPLPPPFYKDVWAGPTGLQAVALEKRLWPMASETFTAGETSKWESRPQRTTAE